MSTSRDKIEASEAWAMLRDILDLSDGDGVLRAVEELRAENERLRDAWAAEERKAWDMYAAGGQGRPHAESWCTADEILEERRKRFPPPGVRP